MATEQETRSPQGRELLGWLILFLGAGALQLPALGRMAGYGVDIIEFELMWTSTEALRTTLLLGEPGLSAARQQLFIDFAYLVIYGVLLWKSCRLLGGRAAHRGVGWIARVAPAFAWTAVVAAACDAVENVALLLITYGHTDQPLPAVASGYATVKFILLALVVLFLVVGLLATLKRDRPEPGDAEPSTTG